MNQEKIKVLVVEDSAFMRTAIGKMLNNSQIEIVDYAVNGQVAIEKIEKLKPDVITLDIEMPVMNGLQFLETIKETNNIPIIVVSTLTTQGAETTIEALELGATDFIAKPDSISKISEMKDELLNKVLILGEKNSLQNRIIRRQNIKRQSHFEKGTENEHPLVRQTEKEKETQKDERNVFLKFEKVSSLKKDDDANLNKNSKLTFTPKVVVIGISTGGPVALQTLIPGLKKDFPVPIVVVQHMPPNFTQSLANRLNSLSEINVKEFEDNETLQAGTVYFAPGGRQIAFKGLKVKIHDNTPENELYKPSFNVTLKSAMENWNEKIVAVVMTGMGHDGTDMMKKLSSIGGYNISQDTKSCVVSGMTSSAINADCVNSIVTLSNIAGTLNKIIN